MGEAFFYLCSQAFCDTKQKLACVLRQSVAAHRAEVFFTELSTLNDQGILIKGLIRDRS